MEREDVVALLDVQRKVFNDVVERLQREIKAARDETSKSIAEVVKSLEFSQAETEDLKREMEAVRKEKLAYETDGSRNFRWGGDLKPSRITRYNIR